MAITAVVTSSAAPLIYHFGTSGAYSTEVGTIKKEGTPTRPGSYRVMLHEQGSGRPVRRLWSDPVTGQYQFAGLAPGKYFVVAFDHTGEYSGVVETDLVVPKP